MAWLWSLPSALVLALAALGSLGAYTAVLSPERGFRVFILGVGLAALSAVALGGAAALGTVLGRAWRRRAVLATLIPVAVSVAVILPNAPKPVINDVTTDPGDPPAFVAGEVREAVYPEGFAELQRAAYPDLAALQSAAPAAEVFRHALVVAASMPRWDVTLEDPQRGVIQAVATSRLFRFRDDIVVRLRPAEGGTRVDLRSRSRVGRGDLGANAARILAFRDALEGRLQAR
jgi:uncharacterized protein (DUF1499 family)